MEITILDQQSLFDIAIQACGSSNHAFEIALLNNLSLTEIIAPAIRLEVPAPLAANRPVANYYANRRITPATALGAEDGHLRLFEMFFETYFE